MMMGGRPERLRPWLQEEEEEEDSSDNSIRGLSPTTWLKGLGRALAPIKTLDKARKAQEEDAFMVEE
jgi:hypothetical protein